MLNVVAPSILWLVLSGNHTKDMITQSYQIFFIIYAKFCDGSVETDDIDAIYAINSVHLKDFDVRLRQRERKI